MFFPPYRHYEIIDTFSNYVIASQIEKDRKTLRDELESYYIERICHLLKSDYHKFDHQEVKDFIFSKFPWGCVLALDAFTEIPINDVKIANLASRQYFRKELLETKKRFDKGESDEESRKRLKWEENLDEFNKLSRGALDEINDEIKRRTNLEKNFKKFLLEIDIKEPLKIQFKKWVENISGGFTDKEINDFAERALKEYMEKEAAENRKLP